MTGDTPPDAGVAWGFLGKSVVLSIDAILPMKSLRADVKLSAKYRQIVTSIRAVGLVEPPVVTADKENLGTYFLLDGHLRIEALKDLGHAKVECLVSTDDEAFTYNKRINRLSAPQEHRMVVRAIERGVSEERLAAALGVNVHSIQRRARLMDGIGDEASEMLKDTPCPLTVFDTLRKMSPLRQTPRSGDGPGLAARAGGAASISAAVTPTSVRIVTSPRRLRSVAHLPNR